MRIALLHYSCPPVIGGVEEVVRHQAELLARHGHEVLVLAGKGSSFSRNVKTRILPLLWSRSGVVEEARQKLRNNCVEAVPEMRRVSSRIRQSLARHMRSYDVLLAHNVMSMHYNLPLTLALLEMAQEGNLRVICWNHDSPYFYRNYSGFLDSAPWNVLKTAFPFLEYVTISESRRKEFSSLYSSSGESPEIRVVPNGVDPVSFFMLHPATVRVAQEQGLFESDFLIVNPSRLHPRKNIEFCIRVVKALLDEGFDARLLVTGAFDPHEENTKNYFEKLRKLSSRLGVKSKVLFMADYAFRAGNDFIHDRAIIRDLYLISDILLLPSVQEGFGIPLLEAGMIKLPVFCSSIPPFRETGGRDVNTFSLNDSPARVARKIISFTSKNRTNRFFRRVMKEYSWESIYSSKLLPLLERVAKKR